jgi:hypothetical protein
VNSRVHLFLTREFGQALQQEQEQQQQQESRVRAFHECSISEQSRAFLKLQLWFLSCQQAVEETFYLSTFVYIHITDSGGNRFLPQE